MLLNSNGTKVFYNRIHVLIFYFKDSFYLLRKCEFVMVILFQPLDKKGFVFLILSNKIIILEFKKMFFFVIYVYYEFS